MGFISRSPRITVIPDWDLHKVLSMRHKAHFKPLKLASLKPVAYKTVFLVAITTFRRCSDVQALELRDGAVTVMNRGVTFVRQGLTRPNDIFWIENLCSILF